MKRKGCLITVLMIVLMLIIASYMVYTNRVKISGAIKGWLTDKMVEQVLNQLPESYDEEVVLQTIDDFKVAITEGQVDGDEFKQISEIFRKMVDDKKLDSSEVDELIKAMQEASQ